MASSDPAGGGLPAGGEGPPPSRFRRRRYLVDPSHQVRVGLAAVGITLLLLVLLDASLFLGRNGSAGGGGWVLDSGLVAAGSLVFLAGVFGVSILETHRTAGAAKSLRETLERFRGGDWGARARLRRGDNLKALASAFNALAGDLHERRVEDLERLERLSESAERDPEGTARALRDLVRERRKELESGG
jgi:hypothetical protein